METEGPPPPSLPILVLQVLFGYLDIFALKALRLVCKATKLWVETDEGLRHFRVRITGKVRLDEVLGALEPVPWNSFVFTESSHFLFSTDIRGFVEEYGELVLRLELERCIGDVGCQVQKNALCLLLGCPNLESLYIAGDSFEPVDDHLARRLLENWKKLRNFHVDIYTDLWRPRPAMKFFSQVLSTCRNLETLTLPNFAWVPTSDFERTDQQRLVVTPLLDAVAQRRLHSVTLTVITKELFLRLALVCRATGTLLYNVNGYFLRNLASQHLSVLDIIGDLNGLRDSIIRQPLTNVRSICVNNSVRRAHTHHFHIDDNRYTMPTFRHLRDVAITFKYSHPVNRQRSLERFADRLASVRRPIVTTFRVEYIEPHPPTLPVRLSPLPLVTAFVNLRVLHVTNWEGEEEEWLNLWALVGHTLVELELDNCPKLDDRRILGNDLSQPAFLQLKYLRKLSVTRAQRNNVTDLSFKQAFRHMPLRSFEFSVFQRHRRIRGKTLTGMWNGRFGETIQEFKLHGKDMMLKGPPKPWWRRCWEKVLCRPQNPNL